MSGALRRYFRGCARAARPRSILALALALALASAPGCKSKPKKSTEKDPHLLSLFQDGNRLLKEEKYAEARQRFEEILVSDPDLTGVRLNAGDSAYMSGDYKEAVAHYRRLLELKPKEWGVMFRLIQAYEALGDSKKADETVRDLFVIRREGKDGRLASARYFVRDRVKSGEGSAQVVEFFDRKGNEYPMWEVHCHNKEKKLDRILHVNYSNRKRSGSDGKPEYILFEGLIGKGGVVYHRWSRPPAYREAKEQIVKALLEPPPKETPGPEEADEGAKPPEAAPAKTDEKPDAQPKAIEKKESQPKDETRKGTPSAQPPAQVEK